MKNTFKELGNTRKGKTRELIMQLLDGLWRWGLISLKKQVFSIPAGDCYLRNMLL